MKSCASVRHTAAVTTYSGEVSWLARRTRSLTSTMANSTKLVSITRKGKSLRALANLRIAASSSEEYPLAEMKTLSFKGTSTV